MNAADQRVCEFLPERFRLFSGVFGASDEVLGALGSGGHFEKRVASIYRQCRTAEQIQFEFDELQNELKSEIAEGRRDAREKLFDNFNQEVVEKVRIQSHDVLGRFNEQLWQLTRYLLADYAHRPISIDIPAIASAGSDACTVGPREDGSLCQTRFGWQGC